MRTALAIIPDPMEPGRELYARVNRRVDVLETERSHGRISEAAYRCGREIQAVFEAATRVGSGSQWKEADRVDMEVAKEAAIHRNIANAAAIDREMRRLTHAVGCVGAAFLREIIGNGTSFADYAERTMTGSRRDAGHVGQRFRSTLEEIVDFRAARGRAT